MATGPNGEFYAAWVGMPARSLLFNASTDGGNTFLPGLASIDTIVHNYVGNLEGPNATFFISGVNRANSFPTIDVDRSTGPNCGMVYIAWAETTNGRDTDIFISRITPHPGSLRWAAGAVPTPYGRIFVWWARDGHRLSLTVAAPPRTTAFIELPDGRRLTLTGGPRGAKRTFAG